MCSETDENPIFVADILGDGRIKPIDLFEGPEWLRGFKGNELQRIVRQLEFARTYYREMRPLEHVMLKKQLFFLFKKLNRRSFEPKFKENPEKYWMILPARYQGRFEKWNKSFD